MLTVPQVYALADAIDPRYRALILLAVFGTLRWGELAALRRKDIDLSACTVTIGQTLIELRGGGHSFGSPKSDAGRRVVAFPHVIKSELAAHLSRFVAADDSALIFTSPTGAPMRNGNFRRRHWLPALSKVGLTGLHFHDLRHTGNNLVAGAGANLRELMERMGHSSTRAALIYLHSTSDRHRTLADSVGAHARKALRGSSPRPADTGVSGTDLARPRQRRA